MDNESDTDTEQSADTAPSEQPEATSSDTVEVEKWRSLARKHEERAKANATAAKELERLKAQAMSDSDRAVAEARTEERQLVTREYGARLVAAEVRAAAAGRPVDVDALLEGVDLGRFLDDEAEPDRRAINDWLDRIAPRPDTSSTIPPMIDLGQGNRGAIPLNGDPLEAMLRRQLDIR